MTDRIMEPRWRAAPPRSKDLTVSEMIHKNGAASPRPGPGQLRAYMVQRTMARHEFTEEQALALILAFGGKGLLKGVGASEIPMERPF